MRGDIQLIVTALTGAATLVSAFCPCGRHLSCHKGVWFGLIGTATFLVIRENG